MSSIDLWYLKEVYIWRTVASITWHLLMLPILTVVYAAVAQFHPLHPITWIAQTLSGMMSLYFITSVGVILAANGVLDWFSSSAYSVIPEVGDTRFQKILRLLKPARLLHMLVFVCVSFLVSWCASLYAGDRFSGLVKYSNEESSVVYLNEPHVMFVLYGMYTGVFMSCQFYLLQLNYLQFPVIQRAKFFQVRSELASLFLRCLRQTFQQIRYFYLLYFLLGGIPRRWIMHNLNLMLSPDVYPLDSVWGLLDWGMAWQLALLGIFLNTSWGLSILLYRVYNTERFEFAVETAFDSQKHKILVDAMTCSSKPLLQYLGYLDLCHLSRFSPERRRQVLTLSQPGGHPHTWNKISAACLADIDALSGQVQDSNWKVMAGATARPASISDAGAGDGSGAPLRYRSSFGSNTPSTSGIPPSGKVGETTPVVTNWKDKVMTFLAQKPVLSYFFSQLPDAKSRQLFANCQKQIWAVEALSYLAATSFMEDKFGIVQRSLPAIMNSVLTLQENVEKHFRLNTSSSRRPQKDMTVPGDAPLRHQLQSTLKTSLYRIISTFGKHLMDVPLSSDCKKKLSPFMDFRE